MLFRQHPSLASDAAGRAGGIRGARGAVERAAVARHRLAGGVAERYRLIGYRVSAHVADVNAAGSYFAMIALPRARHGAARARPTGARSGSRWPRRAASACGSPSRAARWRAAGIVLVVARDVGGDAPVQPARRAPSRSAVVAGRAARRRAPSARGCSRPIPTTAASDSGSSSTRPALRMIGARPLFGVGVGQYYRTSPLFLSPQLAWTYGFENAHNYFLQIGGELGLVGPRPVRASGSAPRSRERRGRSRTRRATARLLGAAGGVAAVPRHLPGRTSAAGRRGGVSVLDAVRAHDGAGGLGAAERAARRRGGHGRRARRTAVARWRPPRRRR